MPEGRQAIDYRQPSILSVRIGSEADVYSAQRSSTMLTKSARRRPQFEVMQRILFTGAGLQLAAEYCSVADT